MKIRAPASPSPTTKPSPAAWAPALQRRRLRRPHPHDQLPQHARRSAGICLPGSPAPVLVALQQRRQRASTQVATELCVRLKSSPMPRSPCSPTAASRGPYGLAGGNDGAPGRTIDHSPGRFGGRTPRQDQHPPACARESAHRIPGRRRLGQSNLNRKCERGHSCPRQEL